MKHDFHDFVIAPLQLPDNASLQGLSAVKEINPLYAALKEWKDEVANDLLESVFSEYFSE